MHELGDSTKGKLINSFIALVEEGKFNHLTIKDITKKAGVVRPTFYHYFQDKYHVFEVILDEKVFDPLQTMVELGMANEAIKMSFKYIEKHKLFFRQAFKTEGQNSFEEIFSQEISRRFIYLMSSKTITIHYDIGAFNARRLANYYALGVVYIVKMWLTEEDLQDYSSDRIYDLYEFLTSHSFENIFENNEEQ